MGNKVAKTSIQTLAGQDVTIEVEYRGETIEIMGRPAVIRHETSGVWIGIIVGSGEYPNSLLLFGRRVWSWSGGRLDTSQIATKGVGSRDRLCEVEFVTIGSIDNRLVEVHNANPEAVRESFKVPAAKV